MANLPTAGPAEPIPPDDPRAVLAALARDRGEDLAGLSRLIGRNPAYIQQFIKRGSPRRLDEADRATLARYFDVDEQRLGGPPPAPALRVADAASGVARTAADLVTVPALAIGASAGPGALVEDRAAARPLGFDPGWLRGLTGGGIAGLSMIRVDGDSMRPTLQDGDDILVDRADAADRLRDGIYVLRLDDGLLVKRVRRDPASGRIDAISDNGDHPSVYGRDPADVHIVGRVVWAGRRFR